MHPKLPILALVLLIACVMFIPVPKAQAERGSTTVEGPGFSYTKKKGWFGSSEETWQDALGNTHTRKTNWLGIPKQESSIMGGKITQSGNDLSVQMPDGTPVVTRKKSWFGGEETKVDGNGLLDSIFGQTP